MVRDKPMAKLAFLGLGVMGYPMAGHLQAAGHEVCVYNRTAAKAEAWAAEVLTLPMFPELSLQQVERVVNVIKQVALSSEKLSAAE